MRKRKILLSTLAVLSTLVFTAVAWAYLHVANAQNYARAHVFRTYCNSSSYTCPTYPYATGWYHRLSNNRVRVEIKVGTRSSGTCVRIFEVRGDDGSEYISSDGSTPWYTCGV